MKGDRITSRREDRRLCGGKDREGKRRTKTGKEVCVRMPVET